MQAQDIIVKLAAGEPGKSFNFAGAELEILSVFPAGFAVAVTLDDASPDIVFPGDKFRPERPFRQVTFANNIWPNAPALTLRIRVSTAAKVGNVARIRDLEIVSYGWGVQTVADGATLSMDIFAVPNSILPSSLPANWALQLKQVNIELLSVPNLVANPVSGVFVEANGSVCGALHQNTPYVYFGPSIPVVLNANGNAAAAVLTARSDYYLLP